MMGIQPGTKRRLTRPGDAERWGARSEAGCSRRWRRGRDANSNRSGTTPATDWMNLPEGMAAAIERLRGVVIENRPAMQVMTTHDGPDTLHFVDPPYLHETRARADRRPDNGGVYRHELTTEEHVELLGFLCGLEGAVVLCGYPSAVYDALLPDWTQVERAAMADGARPRVEVLYLNPKAAATSAHQVLL
jgi:DNA adenine methylase